ncbi:putative F-box protein At4g09190 [Andrographis paniculata]|uniref:putative F-box protein At4g09190 n=1 Tax=Andrographis paniculata TaxID=175694 RepID=UPI0021E8200B|nr:putative F-box protein At4g09190 [Andrographis paniculata]
MAAAKRKNPPISEPEQNLPPDIIESILQRLPAKSIIRFRSVAKIWNSIISDPHFSRIQSNLALSSSSSTLFLARNIPRNPAVNGGLRLLRFRDQIFHPDNTFTFSDPPFQNSEILCSCNGLLLLCEKSPATRCFILSNPLARTHTAVWWPSDRRNSLPANCRPFTQGLCYDRTSGDYKIVIVVFGAFSVYSCRKRIWTKKFEKFPESKIINREGIYADGAFYWIGTAAGKLDPVDVIYFDAAGEKFGTVRVMLPVNIPPADYVRAVVPANLWGKLAICFKFSNVKRTRFLIGICAVRRNGGAKFWDTIRIADDSPPPAGEGCCKHSISQSGNGVCPITAVCGVADGMIMAFMDCTRYVVYDCRERNVVGGIRTFLEDFDSKLGVCKDHMFFPVANVRPWRRCRRTSRVVED